MYVPKEFVETDATEITNIIEAYPLATLVAHTNNGLTASHLPMFRGKDGHFVGHFAWENDLHQIIENGSSVLLIFKGEDSYISPNWYPTKFVHHRLVPTWNYQVVHVHGKIFFSVNKIEKAAAVGKLTNIHETALNGENAWKMSDAPKEYIQDKLEQIVAFRVEVTKIVAKSKLSQNREQVDYDNVVQELDKSGKHQMVKRMVDLQNKKMR